MLETIAKILKDYKSDDELVVTEASTFEELGLDSLDTVELVMIIEEEFSVAIELGENIKSVGDLMATIEAAGNAS
jgi:acyl carrier protein